MHMYSENVYTCVPNKSFQFFQEILTKIALLILFDVARHIADYGSAERK